jgi:DNA-binding NtrC family response regulator
VGSILLVEPDPETCDRWAAELGAAGHAVISATGLRDALPLIRDGGIDVVVIDCYDQCLGVVELGRSIEALPDAPPIVLVSASPAAPEISARIGAASFLAKPCDVAEVVEVVNRLLGELRPVRVVDDEPTGPHNLFGQR